MGETVDPKFIVMKAKLSLQQQETAKTQCLVRIMEYVDRVQKDLCNLEAHEKAITKEKDNLTVTIETYGDCMPKDVLEAANKVLTMV